MDEKPWNAPFHPAEFFIEDFLKPLDMSEQQAADALQMPIEELTPFLREEAPLTVELALRLSQAFGCDPEYWMTWQVKYDLAGAKSRGAPTLPRVPGLPAAA